MTVSSYQQYLRRVGLALTSASDVLDLSQMRVKFRTYQVDLEAPGHAVIRVYNLSDATVKKAKDEFQKVVLQAGYATGNYGVIFQGTIIRIRTGRESAVDSFLEVMAVDGDEGFNEAVVSKTLSAANTSLKNRFDAIAQPMKDKGVGVNNIDGVGTGGVLPRGKVMFALARDPMTDLANSAGATWSVQDGKINVVKLTGYLPDAPIEVNAKTGMVGIPEATINGIDVSMLLNPLVKLGTRIKLDNKSVNRTTNVSQTQGFPGRGNFEFFASEAADGVYRVLVAEHEGDSRGNPFYTYLTCLTVDASAPAGDAVAATG